VGAGSLVHVKTLEAAKGGVRLRSFMASKRVSHHPQRQTTDARVMASSSILCVPFVVLVLSSPAASAQTTEGTTSNGVALEKLHRSNDAPQPGNLFGPQSWQPRVRERKVAPPPPPPPEPPPLPYAYLGKWTENGDTQIVLAKQRENVLVRAGETLDDVYRVESVGEGQLVFRYLPLDVTQVLPFSTATNRAAPKPKLPLNQDEHDDEMEEDG
jgi:hypothetical protein